MGFNDFSIRGIDFNNDGRADMLDDILMDEMEEEELAMLEEDELEERRAMRRCGALGDMMDEYDDEYDYEDYYDDEDDMLDDDFDEDDE